MAPLSKIGRKEEGQVAVVSRLGVGCKGELTFGYIWAIWEEICSWIVFESEAHNPHNCYHLGINFSKLFLIDVLIFYIRLKKGKK